MKVLIHDIADADRGIFAGKCDELIAADGKYAPCQGCFGCWTKTPAECFMKDRLREISRVVGNADELVIITENCYGSYSPAVKNVLDRSIGLSTPFSSDRGRQMHHTLRYGRHGRLSVIAYGDMTEAEADTMRLFAERNAINFGFGQAVFTHIDDPGKAAELL
jgi:multimeric flavodoxin WrbA